MKNTIKELYMMLEYAQEEDNQMLINVLAQDLASKMIEIDSSLDYNQLLIQYGYCIENKNFKLNERRR